MRGEDVGLGSRRIALLRMLHPKRWRKGRTAALTVILCGLAMLRSEPATAQTAPTYFDIPAQPLSSALLEIGRQARLSIALPSNLPVDPVSRPVKGTLEPVQALAALLEGSRLRFHFIDPETVVVEIEKTADTAPMPPAAMPPPRRTASAAIKGAGPEEVIVTARRREERLQSVPLAVTVFTPADIRDRNITSTQDLGNFVPSLVTNNNSGFAPGFVLRGQGSTLGAGPGVVAYFAEVPIVNGQNATGAFQGGTGAGMFYDLDSVQVLKGPQGTLFGRNTTGGAILFTPQKPTNSFEGYGQLTLGDYNWYEFEGAINLPIAEDKLLLRFAADVAMRDGYTKDVGPYFPGKDYDNRDYWAFRVSAVMRPTDDVENYLIASSLYLHQNGTGGSIFAVKPGGLAVEAFPGIAAYLAQQQAIGPRETEESTDQIDKQWTYGVIDIARWDIGDHLILKNIVGYQANKNSTGYIDFDNSPFPIQDLRVARGWAAASEQYSEELQLSGRALDDRLRWTTGLYAEYDKPTDTPEYDDVQPVAGTSGAYQQTMIALQGSTTQRTRAAYAQATYDLSGLWTAIDRLNFTAGYRYTWDDRSDTGNISIPNSGNSCPEKPGFVFPNCGLAARAQFHAPTWTLGLDYQVTPRTLLYVGVRRGYKSGGFNLNTPEHSAYSIFRPERVTDLELGVKTDWEFLGIKARTNIAAFHTDYSNIQRTVSVLINGLSAPVTENAAVATIQGVELEGTVIPASRTEISLAYSYLASKYDRYLSPTLGSLAGLQFPFTPKNKVSVTGRYHMPVSSHWGDPSLSATYSLQSAVNAGPDFSATNVIEGYGLLSARLDWDAVLGSRFDAALFVTNATDKVYVTRVSGLYNIFGVAGASYGEPRIFGAELRYRFGP